MIQEYLQPNYTERGELHAEWESGYRFGKAEAQQEAGNDLEQHYQADMAARTEQAAASIKLLRAAVADLRKQARQAEYLSTEFNRLASAIVAMEISIETILEISK